MFVYPAGGTLLRLVACLQVCEVLSTTLYQYIVDSQTRFNYDPDPNNKYGVYNWPRTYMEKCSGESQSPVNINTINVRYGLVCACPLLIYSSHILKGEIKNNGLSPEFEPDTPEMLQLINVPYRSGTYYLNDFHFHYGGVTGRRSEVQGLRFRGSGIMSAGSEHTIDGLRFDGEIHFVFYNNKYKNLEEAESKPDGVVIISILVQKVTDVRFTNGKSSRFASFLETSIPLIKSYKMKAKMEVNLTMFFDRDCEYYTYSGSTTTPRCHESVRWIIYKDPIMINESAWYELTGLESRGDFNSFFGNYRTTQPLNSRVIEANFIRQHRLTHPSSVSMNNGNLLSSSLNEFHKTMTEIESHPTYNVRSISMMGRDMLREVLITNMRSNANREVYNPIVINSSLPNRNNRFLQMTEMKLNSNVPDFIRDIPDRHNQPFIRIKNRREHLKKKESISLAMNGNPANDIIQNLPMFHIVNDNIRNGIFRDLSGKFHYMPNMPATEKEMHTPVGISKIDMLNALHTKSQISNYQAAVEEILSQSYRPMNTFPRFGTVAKARGNLENIVMNESRPQYIWVMKPMFWHVFHKRWRTN